MSSDPHVLVALASVGIGRYLANDTSRAAHVIAYNRAHTFPVLDAIASICVSHPESQAVAVALQIDSESREIRLTIAESGLDGKVSQNIDHITNIWALLRDISDLNTKLRLKSYPSPSAPIPTPLNGSHRLKIMSLIYCYSIKKVMKRFTKWWQGLKLFADEFKRVLNDLPGTPDVKKHFMDMFLSINYAYDTLQRVSAGIRIPEDEWVILAIMMDGAVSDMGVIFKAGLICEVWAKKMDAGGGAFRVRHALEKLTSLHRNVQALLAFAGSRSLRCVFEYRMAIATVPMHQAVGITLPSSTTEWKSVMQHVCAEYKPLNVEWLNMESKRLTQQIQGGAVQHDNVHCECALISYLESSHLGATPPLRYIGVSRLSCGACHAWLEAFNARGGRKYHIHGYHGRWCWPWAMPTTTPVDMLDKFTEVVSRNYTKYQRDSGRLRLASKTPSAAIKSAETQRSQRLKHLRAVRAERELQNP